MIPISLRRTLGAAAALLCVTAGLSLGASAGVASAAPVEHFSVSTGFDRTVPVRGGGHGAAFRPLSVLFFDTTENTLLGVKVSVDGTAVRGFAELDLPAGCAYASADHLHESCVLGDARNGSGEFAVGVRALPGAKGGATGRVVFKVTARNGQAYTDPANPQDTVGVTVGDGPDLAGRGCRTAAPTRPRPPGPRPSPA
jgi:hypothetical protein